MFWNGHSLVDDTFYGIFEIFLIFYGEKKNESKNFRNSHMSITALLKRREVVRFGGGARCCRAAPPPAG